MNNNTDIIYKEGFRESIKDLVTIPHKNSIVSDSITSKQRKEYQEKINRLHQMIELEPDNWEHIERRGDLNYKMGRHDKALLDYLDANNLGQDDEVNIAKCLCARGIIKEKAGFDEDALEDYEMANGIDILNPYYYFRKGCIEVKQNKIDDAVDSLSFASEYAGSTEPGSIPKFQIVKNESYILMLI